MRKIVLIVLTMVLLASSAFAVEGKLDGVIFGQYMNTPASGASAFDITRAYLTYIAEISPMVKMRYTSDVTRDTSGRQDLFAKYAWLEANKALLGGRLRFGLIETPWIGFEDGIWGYRLQGTNFADRLGLVSSADFGLTLDGKLLGDSIEYFGAVVNGAGYKAAETDKTKRVELRLTARPITNISVSGFYSKDNWTDSANKPRDRYIAQVAYKDKNYTLAGDYASAIGSTAAGKNGAGYSVFGTAKLSTLLDLLKGYTLIARLDQWDPDSNAASDATTRYIAGISYELVKGTLILFDVDRYRTESGAGNSTSVYAHTQIKF